MMYRPKKDGHYKRNRKTKDYITENIQWKKEKERKEGVNVIESASGSIRV
jgi:hypothetical protein